MPRDTDMTDIAEEYLANYCDSEEKCRQVIPFLIRELGLEEF